MKTFLFSLVLALGLAPLFGAITPTSTVLTDTNRLVISPSNFWSSNFFSINVKQPPFNAKGDGVIDDTAAIQKAIDAAITNKGHVFFPPGVYLVAPGAWGDYVLLLGYSSYDQVMGLKSATHPTTPYQESPQFGALTLEGAEAGKRLARIDTTPHQTYSKGAVIKFTGTMTGKLGLQTGYYQRNIKLKNLTFVGTGQGVTSIGVRHNALSSFFDVENCDFQHWGTAIDIGGDYGVSAAAASDWNRISDTRISYTDIGVKVNHYNAYLTEIFSGAISARIPIWNAMGADAVFPSPPVKVFGGFLSPLTEYNGVLLQGTVAAAAASQITLTNLTKTVKVRNASFALTTNITAGSIADVTTNMFALVEGNEALTGAARVPEWGVLNQITSVNPTTWALGVIGNVNHTLIVGSPVYVFLPAAALWGDNFHLFGTHIEAVEAEDFGFGPMLAWLKGWRSTTTFDSVFVNLFSLDTGFNRIQPKIYHNPSVGSTGFPLELNNCVFNVRFPKMEVSATMGVRSRNNTWMTEPLFLDHNGNAADGVVREGDSSFVKLRTEFGSGGGAEWYAQTPQMGRDRYEQLSGEFKRITPVTSTQPTKATSGEVFILENDTPKLALYRAAVVNGVPGYYDATVIDATATINIVTDATLATVNKMTNLYIGRVISIAGAGPAAAALTTRIVDMKVNAAGTVRTIYLFNAASTTVTGAVISAVAPVIESFARQGEFGTASPATGTYRTGDLVWHQNPVANGKLGFICVSGGSPGTWQDFGTIGTAATFGTNTATTVQLTVKGGTAGTDMFVLDRTEGVVQKSSFRQGSASTTLYDVTGAGNMWSATKTLFTAPSAVNAAGGNWQVDVSGNSTQAGTITGTGAGGFSLTGGEQAGDPAAPVAGSRLLYPKSTGWFERNSAGTVVGPFGVGTVGGTGTPGVLPYFSGASTLADSPVSRVDADTARVANLQITTNLTAAAAVVTNDFTVDATTFQVSAANNSLGIGVTPTATSLLKAATASDLAAGYVFAGLTKAVRVGTTTALALVEGVDNTGVVSYQPLVVNGSTLSLRSGAVERIGISAAGVINVANLTASQAVFTDASKNLVSVATTGTGSAVLATSPTITTPVIAQINDANGNEELIFTATASAVNELTVANAATGGAPTISATGGDANIDIAITPKGTGMIRIPDGTAANPGLGFGSSDDGSGTGFHRLAAVNDTAWSANGADILGLNANKFITVPNDGVVAWVSGALDGSIVTELRGTTANTLQLGRNLATPNAQAITFGAASGTDKAAAATATLIAPLGTGTGTDGAFVVSTGTGAQATSSTLHTARPRMWIEGDPVTLTETVATTIATISVGAALFVGGEALVTVFASDGTDHQSLTSTVKFDAISKAGVITATATQTDNTTAASAGTLTATYTTSTSGGNFLIQCNATSSLPQTTLKAALQMRFNGTDATTVTVP